jgi:hypothetical protein
MRLTIKVKYDDGITTQKIYLCLTTEESRSASSLVPCDPCLAPPMEVVSDTNASNHQTEMLASPALDGEGGVFVCVLDSWVTAFWADSEGRACQPAKSKAKKKNGAAPGLTL